MYLRPESRFCWIETSDTVDLETTFAVGFRF